MNPLHIAVLMGGWSAEREVSLVTGAGVAEALQGRGHRVTRIDMGRDVAQRLSEARPDVVFNALHGTPGEDGTVQGLMDLMGLKYTHSGLATSVVAIDKELTKQVLVPHGIRMPPGASWRARASTRPIRCRGPMCSSRSTRARPVGVAIVTHGGNHGDPIGRGNPGPWQEFDQLLAEPFIRGRELTVAVLGGEALAVTELQPKSAFTIMPPNIRTASPSTSAPPTSPAAITTRRCGWRWPRTAISAAAARRAPTSAGTTSRASRGCTCSRSTRSPA
jgi:D-alanine-D-alanine ligase